MLGALIPASDLPDRARFPAASSPHLELLQHDLTFPFYVEVDEICNPACSAGPINYQLNPMQTTKTSLHAVQVNRALTTSSAESVGGGRRGTDRPTALNVMTSREMFHRIMDARKFTSLPEPTSTFCQHAPRYIAPGSTGAHSSPAFRSARGPAAMRVPISPSLRAWRLPRNAAH
jgi:hypothetical protein